MKKLALAILFVLIWINASYAEINTDISNSTVEILNSTTMRIRNLTAEGYSGKYWIDFQWDSSALVYRPIQVGTEVTTNNNKSCSVNVTGSFNTVWHIVITVDSTDKQIFLSVTCTDKGTSSYGYIANFTYTAIKFKQFDNTFKLTLYSPYSNTAKFTPDGWGGSEEIAQGVTRTGTISSIPTWFDFEKSYYFVYNDTSYPCD